MARTTRYKGIKKLGEKTFHVRVTTTDPRTGKRKEKKETVEGAIEDALAMREQLRAQLEAGPINAVTAPRPRVGEFAQLRMKRKILDLSPATAEQHAIALDQHILPRLGDYFFEALTRDDVQAWVAERLKKGYKVGTVKSWFRVLVTMTRDAMAG